MRRWHGKAARVKFRRLGVGLLLAVAMSLAWATPGWGAVVLSTQSVSQVYGDDVNTSTLYGTAHTNPAVPQYYDQTCSWVVSGLGSAGFTNASGWNFNWAGTAIDDNMKGDLSYTTYKPWVVQVPTYNDPNGGAWGGSFPPDASGTKYEAGGAQPILSFNPTGNANDPLKAGNLPAGATVHWIQAYVGTAWGETVGSGSGNLDGSSAGKPFYDREFRRRSERGSLLL